MIIELHGCEINDRATVSVFRCPVQVRVLPGTPCLAISEWSLIWRKLNHFPRLNRSIWCSILDGCNEFSRWTLSPTLALRDLQGGLSGLSRLLIPPLRLWQLSGGIRVPDKLSSYEALLSSRKPTIFLWISNSHLLINVGNQLDRVIQVKVF